MKTEEQIRDMIKFLNTCKINHNNNPNIAKPEHIQSKIDVLTWVLKTTDIKKKEQKNEVGS